MLQGFVASTVCAMSFLVDCYQQAEAYGEYIVWQRVVEHFSELIFL